MVESKDIKDAPTPVEEVPVEEKEVSTIEQVDHWMVNVFPGWKNKIGVLLTAIAPFLYITGTTFDIEALKELLTIAPEAWAVLSLIGSLIARIGYSAKKRT